VQAGVESTERADVLLVFPVHLRGLDARERLGERDGGEIERSSETMEDE
tara:strand:- start:854 stop:1000 length:147 start_codon:yes stop_codon:yes gene_type:complete